MNHIMINRKRKGLSPILATVILIGITVAAGGAVYAIYTGSSTSASSSNVIRVDTLSAVKGSHHADFAVTITNVGSTPWKSMEVWIGKEATGRPILYEELHELAVGNSVSDTDAKKEIKNALRVDAIGTVSDGFGVGLGRKFVLLASDATYSERKVALAVPSTFVVGTDNLTELDAKWKGAAGDCTDTKGDFDGDGTADDAGCSIKTGMILSAPIAPGQSMRFYADLLLTSPASLSSDTRTILNGYTAAQLLPAAVSVGDELTVNIKAVGINGEETQTQSVVQVTGA